MAENKITGLLLEDKKDSARVQVGSDVKEITKKGIVSTALATSSMTLMGSLLLKRELCELVRY